MKQKLKDAGTAEQKRQQDRYDLGFELLRDEMFDVKSEGISCLEKIVKKIRVEDIKLLEPVIDKYVFEWATCDGLSCHFVTKAMVANADIIPVIPS